MIQLKVGVFPGRLEEYAVPEGTTVREVLGMANISVGEEQETKLDGEAISLDSVIPTDSNVLIVGKRIKGAF